jgi:hypothetical protein
MSFRFDEMDEVDKFFATYVFLYLVVFLFTYLAWLKGDYKEFETPEGQEAIEEQPETWPF